MGAFFHSPRGFWSAALIAAVVVLAGSVELGKVVGATLLARGAARPAAAPVLAPTSGALEVLGGQTHAAAAPGQSSPIWPSATPRRPAGAPAPGGDTNARTTQETQSAPRVPIAAPATGAVPRAPAAPKPQPRDVQSHRQAPPSVPRPTLTPIVQITPPDQNLGY